MGSLVHGTGRADVNGFKIVLDDDELGGHYLALAPSTDPLFNGSPLYKRGKIIEPNRVAQNKQAAVWLARGSSTPWTLLLPDSLPVEVVDGITFIQGQRAWVALTPINAKPLEHDAVKTEAVHWKIKKTKKVESKKALLPHHQVLAASGDEGPFSGFAVEVGEVGGPHASYADLVTAVVANTTVTSTEQGTATYTASDGTTVGLTFKGPIITRDGKPWNYQENAPKFASPNLESAWDDGTFTIRCNGAVFTGTLTADGAYTWTEEFSDAAGN
jgi:hypothetical protein